MTMNRGFCLHGGNTGAHTSAHCRCLPWAAAPGGFLRTGTGIEPLPPRAGVGKCQCLPVQCAPRGVSSRQRRHTGGGSHHVTVKIGAAPRAVHKPNAGRGTVRAREVEGTEAACARESDSSQADSAIAVQPRERTVAKLDHAVIAPPRNCLDVGVATVVPREVVLAGRPACGAPNEPAKAGRNNHVKTAVCAHSGAMQRGLEPTRIG